MFDTKDNLYPLAELIPVIVVFGALLLIGLALMLASPDDDTPGLEAGDEPDARHGAA